MLDEGKRAEPGSFPATLERAGRERDQTFRDGERPVLDCSSARRIPLAPGYLSAHTTIGVDHPLSVAVHSGWGMWGDGPDLSQRETVGRSNIERPSAMFRERTEKWADRTGDWEVQEENPKLLAATMRSCIVRVCVNYAV